MTGVRVAGVGPEVGSAGDGAAGAGVGGPGGEARGPGGLADGDSPGPGPALARWALVAGWVANGVLLVTFFLNWTWWLQLAVVLPFGAVWFLGWWRWQGALDRHEIVVLEARIRAERLHEGRCGAVLASGVPDEEDRFEWRYQERRARERREEAEVELALRRAHPSGWRRRQAGLG